MRNRIHVVNSNIYNRDKTLKIMIMRITKDGIKHYCSVLFRYNHRIGYPIMIYLH